MNGRLLLGILCMTSLSCAHTAPAPVAAPSPAENGDYYGQEALQGILWMQHSAEYHAAARQTYANATRALDAALADAEWNAVSELESLPSGSLRPAVILDIDETCVDNSVYEAELMRAKLVHSDERFEEFVQGGRVTAIPGALEFLRYAASRGVAVFYITNQNVKLEPPTRANLRKLGFPVDDAIDTVLTVAERPEWTSDKASRRLHVAQQYRVLLLLGDDFNDFVTASGKTTKERAALLHRQIDRFGSQWFLLPNPVYGSWERSLISGAGKGNRERFDAKLKALRTTVDD